MKRTLLLLMALLTIGGGAWADDVTVTISDKTDLGTITSSNYSATAEHKYGTYSNPAGGTTFTTNATAGVEGLTLTADGNYVKAYYYSNTNYLYGFAVTPTSGAGNSATITIKAPTGYYIKNYSMKAISTSDKGQFTLTPFGGTATNVSSSVTTVTPTVCGNTATFTVTRKSDATNTQTELCFPTFTITLVSTNMTGDATISFNSSTGSKYRDGESNVHTGTSDFQKFVTTSSPAGLTLTCSGNSMNNNETAMRLHNFGNTYTLTAPTGYFIKGYKMVAYAEGNNTQQTVKPATATVTTLISGSSESKTIVCVDNVNSQSTTFVRGTNTSGSNAYVNTELTVYLIPTYTVTYNIVDESNTTWATFTEEVTKGTEITDLPALYKRAYCSYNMTGQTITANTTIDVTCTYSGPTNLVFASSVEDATTNNKWMELKRQDNTHYVYYDGATLAYTATDLSTADGYQWAVIGNPYGYKIYNKGAKGYLSASIPTTNAATKEDFTFNETGVTFELYRYSGRSNNDHFVSVVQGTNTNVNTGTVLNESGSTWKLWCGLNNTAGFVCNNGSMTGLSTSFLLPMAVPTTFTVAYNVVDGSGNQIATANIEVDAANNGDDAANHLPSALSLAGCSFTYSPTTVSETNDVITVSYTYDAGVNMKVYENYSDISTWYFLKLKDKDYIVYDSESTPNVQRSTDLPDGDNASWALVGNPYQGFNLYNRGAGSTVWAVSTTPDTSDGGESATVSLAAMGDVQKWFISSSTYFTNGFFLGNSAGYRLNGRKEQTTLSYWTNNADDGSTFVAIGNEDYASAVAELASWFTTNVGNYFALSQDAYNAQHTNYTNYSSSATYKQYQELKSAIEAGIVYPETGYYRIKSSGKRDIGESYIGYGQPTYNSAGLLTAAATNAASDASTIIKFTGSKGTYKLSTQGLNVQAQTARDYAFPATAADGVEFTFNILAPGVVSIHNDASYVSADFNGDLHEAGWTVPGVVNWNASSVQSQWTVEEVNSLSLSLNGPIDGKYYATLCLPFTVTLSGAEAYTLTLNANKDGLTLSDAMTEVPAGTPVLLRGESATATAAIANNAAYVSAPLTTTSLTGTFVDKSVAAKTDYFLGTDDTNVGFYKWDGTTLKANRAYLEASKVDAAGVKGFALDFDLATAIDDIVNGKSSNGKWYNLAGQRVGQASRLRSGIYIVGDKKVVIK